MGSSREYLYAPIFFTFPVPLKFLKDVVVPLAVLHSYGFAAFPWGEIFWLIIDKSVVTSSGLSEMI
jgi:hypothetical protein